MVICQQGKDSDCYSEEMQVYRNKIERFSSESLENQILVSKQWMEDSLAQHLLEHLCSLQRSHGCVMVDSPKLIISEQKFQVCEYVSYYQLSHFFAFSDVIPRKTFGIQADWETIYMFRLFSRGIDFDYHNADEMYSYCQNNFLNIYLPMRILYKYYRPYLSQNPKALILDLYLD